MKETCLCTLMQVSCNVHVHYCGIVLSFGTYLALTFTKSGLSVIINTTRQLCSKSIHIDNLPIKINFGSFAVRKPACDKEDIQCVPTSCNDSRDDPVASQVKTLIIRS